MKEPAAKRVKTEPKVSQQYESDNGVWEMIDAPLASRVADYLELEDIVRLSRTSKKLHGFFNKNVFDNAMNQLKALQAALRFENIDGMSDFLFEKYNSKVSLKPRVKKEIQAILRLCEIHRICTDAFTSFSNSEWKTWPEEHQNIATTLATCQQSVNPLLLKNNMIDVMLAYSDIFLMIKKTRIWDEVDNFAITRLGQAQKNAGLTYINTILTGFRKGRAVDGHTNLPQRPFANLPVWFDSTSLGRDYFFTWGRNDWSKEWQAFRAPNGQESFWRGYHLEVKPSQFQNDMITAALKPLLEQASNSEEYFSEPKSLSP